MAKRHRRVWDKHVNHTMEIGTFAQRYPMGYLSFRVVWAPKRAVSLPAASMLIELDTKQYKVSTDTWTVNRYNNCNCYKLKKL